MVISADKYDWFLSTDSTETLGEESGSEGAGSSGDLSDEEEIIEEIDNFTKLKGALTHYKTNISNRRFFLCIKI